ncbi:MAG: hypothetical protein EOM23_09530 [Candidatus Moranbacteria bacterium]|nr:hypothetical protein [Candidatus Moranbacteria bacterium]
MDIFKKKKLPANTNISTYVSYRGHTFEHLRIPDGRILVQKVHHWDDGELMTFGFEYSDGKARSGINPLDIVGIFEGEKDKRTSTISLAKEIAVAIDGFLMRKTIFEFNNGEVSKNASGSH